MSELSVCLFEIFRFVCTDFEPFDLSSSNNFFLIDHWFFSLFRVICFPQGPVKLLFVSSEKPVASVVRDCWLFSRDTVKFSSELIVDFQKPAYHCKIDTFVLFLDRIRIFGPQAYSRSFLDLHSRSLVSTFFLTLLWSNPQRLAKLSLLNAVFF